MGKSYEKPMREGKSELTLADGQGRSPNLGRAHARHASPPPRSPLRHVGTGTNTSRSERTELKLLDFMQDHYLPRSRLPL